MWGIFACLTCKKRSVYYQIALIIDLVSNLSVAPRAFHLRRKNAVNCKGFPNLIEPTEEKEQTQYRYHYFELVNYCKQGETFARLALGGIVSYITRLLGAFFARGL